MIAFSKPQIIQKEVQVKHITLCGKQTGNVVFDISKLYRHFAGLTDRRDPRGRIYPLPYLLMTIFLAKVSGQHTPTGIAEWIWLRRRQLWHAFAAYWRAAPSLNTIRRTLADSILAAELQDACRRFLHEVYGGQESVLIVIDGKSMRGTIAKGETQGVHLLAAYLPEEGVVLAQEPVACKENELSAAPRILAELNLRQKVVCGDAMFTHRDLSVQILGAGGDYLWFVKENQPRLAADVQRFFEPLPSRPGWHHPPLPERQAQQSNKGHGRLERRTLTAITDETAYLDWPGVVQVFKIERRSCCLRTGELTEETAYGITSLTAEDASAERLLQLTRGYWGIENGLHYRRDTTLREDQTRMSQATQAEAVAVLNNFIIGLARKLGFSNLAAAQRRFDAAINLQLNNFL